MIKDLQLLRDITPLFEKKIIVWGIGNKGRVLIEKMEAMGAGKKGIVLCDSKRSLWGEMFLEHKIMSPAETKAIAEDIGLDHVVILVTVLSVEAQDEIIKEIERMLGTEAEIYTEYAVEYGLYLGICDPHVETGYREKELKERQAIRRLPSRERSMLMIHAYRYFTFLPLHDDEIILVYQPGKVASSTVYDSIRSYGRNVLHCHILAEFCDNEDDIYKLLRLKGAKVICLVRDPVARRISEMWQNIANVERYAIDADLSAVEEYYFGGSFEDHEFDWFDHEMKRTLHIDVFDAPFDRDKGYAVIEQGNIKLLLLKMEKLDGAQRIIGDFLGIEDFELKNKNVGEEKHYRFALKEYKKDFRISQERAAEIYKENERMRHFYTPQECGALYTRWIQ